MFIKLGKEDYINLDFVKHIFVFDDNEIICEMDSGNWTLFCEDSCTTIKKLVRGKKIKLQAYYFTPKKPRR